MYRLSSCVGSLLVRTDGFYNFKKYSWYTNTIDSFKLKTRSLRFNSLAIRQQHTEDCSTSKPDSSRDVKYLFSTEDYETYKINKERDILTLSGGDPTILKKLRLVEMQVDLLQYRTGIVPKINLPRWRDLLDNNDNKNALTRLIAVIFRDSVSSARKRYKRLEYLQNYSTLETKDRAYGLFINSLFIRVGPQAIRAQEKIKIQTAKVFSSKLIIDCSYQEFMRPQEVSNLSKQITHVIHENGCHPQPFHLVLCNFDRNDGLGKRLSAYRLNVYDDISPVTFCEGSYLDMFPKEELVYLTPHCRNVMREFDHTKKYIIGAFVDKTKPQPISMAKAKKYGLEVAKFPIDNYLEWGIGKKTLTLDVVLKILLDMRYYKDWSIAFNHIPKRFLVPAEERFYKKYRENSLLQHLKDLQVR